MSCDPEGPVTRLTVAALEIINIKHRRAHWQNWHAAEIWKRHRPLAAKHYGIRRRYVGLTETIWPFVQELNQITRTRIKLEKRLRRLTKGHAAP